MNAQRLLHSLRHCAILAAAAFIFSASLPGDAQAQRALCKKVQSGCTIPEEEIETPDPTAGNKKFYFADDLKDSSSLTATGDSSSSKTFKPDIKGYTSSSKKWRKSGRSKNNSGSLEFDGEEDNRRSCAWIPKSLDPNLPAEPPHGLPLKGKYIHAAYSLKFSSDEDDERGEGTVLAFLPDSVTISSTLCGGYGEYLGYADNGSYTSMPEPRFGLEIDINRNSGLSDPSDNNHMSIVYNGVKHDNTLAPTCPSNSANNDTMSPYGACWTGADIRKRSSLNWDQPAAFALKDEFPWSDEIPTPPTEIKVADRRGGDHGDHGGGHDSHYKNYPWLEDGSTHNVRVEITTNKADCSGQTHIKAWVCQSDDSACNKSTSFKLLGTAFTGNASAVVEKCLPFDPNTYPYLVVGFTSGVGDHSSKITYSNFMIQTFDNK